MEINQGNADEVEQVEQVVTPDIVGKSFAEAEKLLKENGLELVLESDVEDTEALVKEQVPSAGIVVKKGSKVFAKWVRLSFLVSRPEEKYFIYIFVAPFKKM